MNLKKKKKIVEYCIRLSVNQQSKEKNIKVDNFVCK